ncbi:hypothetical protein [Roseofilum capinflatum]|uniref:Uncharacterized protein n=1 Tax=Roseofilum capinflatum BLCC-M114 TaxID=3022440 RepID=A0ABT7BCB8_9CYAN|nr:hypothetical protein [Roseofilum capinflatum]MDJ1176807.1 hypothetical protein [Roseofilum capinflatum BLCC-M114]
MGYPHLPIPHSPFPIPHSLFPIPYSPFPIPHSPFPPQPHLTILVDLLYSERKQRYYNFCKQTLIQILP